MGTPTPDTPAADPAPTAVAEPGPPPPEPPPAPAPARRALRWLLALLGAVSLALLLALGWLVMLYPDRTGPGDGEVRALELEAGTSVEAVAGLLGQRGLIEDVSTFALYARVRGAGERLRVGRLLVREGMTPRQLLARVAEGFGSVQLRVVFPEGFTRHEIAERLGLWGVCDGDAWLRLTELPGVLRALGVEASTAEGWIFPDTYMLMSDSPPRAVLRRMVRVARRRFDGAFERHAAGLARLEADLGWGRQDVITLASIVEAEAAVAAELPVIAGVFLNRLSDPEFRPKRLQADPTVSYGCRLQPSLPSCAGFDGRRITRAMLAGADNPYNTYRHEGLPPGPVGNPGLAAVEAVLAPAEHDYLYFVARGGGRHAFSATLEEHNRAVERYLRR